MTVSMLGRRLVARCAACRLQGCRRLSLAVGAFKKGYFQYNDMVNIHLLAKYAPL